MTLPAAPPRLAGRPGPLPYTTALVPLVTNNAAAAILAAYDETMELRMGPPPGLVSKNYLKIALRGWKEP